VAEQTDWRETELTTEEVERLWETQRRRIEQEWALVIGIGAYQSDFRPLTNAPQDAKEVAKLLRDDYGFDLHPTGKPLLDEEAGLSAICQAVEETLAQAANRTRWMFYFAGHGVVVDGRGYLVPADAHKGETDSYLSLDWLRKRCLDAECAEILIVLDACYSGRALVRPEHFVDFIPDEREEERIRHLICSGSPDQPVLDGGGSGHSVFTQSLLEALQGWAGIHQESGIDFLSLWGYLVLDVPARLRSQGKNPAIQQPVGGNLIGSRWRLTLIATAPRLSPEIVRGARSEEPTYRQHNLARLVDEVLNPKVDWRDVLRRFMAKCAKTDRSFARPSRRFISQGLYMPSRSGEALGEICFAIDCSGSIGQHDLDQFAAEVKQVKEDLNPSAIHVIYFDSVLSHYDKFSRDDDISISMHGGGGTDFAPVFAYMQDNDIQPVACVFLTDLHCNSFGDEPDCPVLWVSNGDDKAPFGEVVLM